MNNATNAFRQTGLYPYNPNCKSWSGAIDTLGLGNNDSKGKVQYEIYPTLPQKQLTDDEKKILRDGLNINPENEITGLTGDAGVAFMQAEHVLKRWCEDIEQAVSEGEQYEQYASIYLPKANTEAKKIALTLVHFKKVDCNNLPKHSVAQKEKSKKR